jgi:HSP20 family molecular chaperone IbpA
MNFFNDDPFESIVREFFGESPSTKRYRDKTLVSEEDERIIDYIEEDDKVFFVFELPGYSENDVSVSVDKGYVYVKAVKKDCENDGVQSYLSQKLCRGVSIRKKLPNFVKDKIVSQSMRNGVLEVSLKRK